MGDYAGSYEHTGGEEVKYVVHEDWMLNAGTDDAGALNEGENFYEEEEYDNEEEEYNYEAGINFELEYSYTCDSNQQVAVEGGSEPIRSASTGHQVVLVEDASESSKSSKSSHDDKPKLKPKTKKTKGARRQFKHLQEPPLDASSDPGYGGSSESLHPEDARSLSINVVTSWLEDAALEEHPKDGMLAEHGSIPPQRLPPPPAPRRSPPGAAIRAPSSRRSSSLPVPQYEYEAQDCGKTPAWDPSGSQYQGYEEDHRVALYDASADIPSIYRREAKPLDKAFKFMRTGALGFASASRSAAIGFGNASKVAAVVMKSKTMEMKSQFVPVVTPIIQAVLEESKQNLMGPDQDRGRGAPVSSMGGGPGEAGEEAGKRPRKRSGKRPRPRRTTNGETSAAHDEARHARRAKAGNAAHDEARHTRRAKAGNAAGNEARHARRAKAGNATGNEARHGSRARAGNAAGNEARHGSRARAGNAAGNETRHGSRARAGNAAGNETRYETRHGSSGQPARHGSRSVPTGASPTNWFRMLLISVSIKAVPPMICHILKFIWEMI